jgi:hypothetical protein
MNPKLKYKVIIHNHDWDLAEDWCLLNVGRFDQDWYKLGIDPVSHLFNDQVESTWYFRNEKDALMFRLKWS